MSNATTTEAQSCYPDEIKTLRQMLDDERTKMARWSDKSPSDATAKAISGCSARIEALVTAIEALGGAL